MFIFFFKWRIVRLEDTKICDWDKFVFAMKKHKTISLDTRGMLFPTEHQDLEHFWAQFCKAIEAATNLEVLELYRCPVKVVSEVMRLTPQLTILNATSIK